MTGCSNNSQTTGNGVIINHDDGYATLYMHLAPNSVFVEIGNRVRQGAVIGLSGDTGYTVPCINGDGYDHLHFSKQNQNLGPSPWTTTQPVYFAEYPNLQLSANTSYLSRNYDAVVLYAHAPVPDANYSSNGYHYVEPYKPLRPELNTADLSIYPISGPGPISPGNGWSDDASALHVPEGVQVKVYRDSNYQGVSELFANKDSWLPDNAIGNDTISSLRYEGVWLYEDINYNNVNPNDPYVKKADFFPTSPNSSIGTDNNLTDNYIGNDVASSIVVSYNWRVTLYQHANYGGAQLVLGAGTYPDLRNFSCAGCGGTGTWNDQASSIRVERLGP